MKRLPTLGKEGLLSESNSVLSIGTARAAKCWMYLTSLIVEIPTVILWYNH